ncbi:MAG: 30S ribosomal protein S4 [Endomicrobia bacterium]|nr:30S ribosomal protein S4 [Endomicrobiia bacterium]
MVRYIAANCKLCRREKQKLFLKGEKCLSQKCPLEKKKYPPGQHGKKQTKLTEYGKRLREKQKLKYMAGLTERQLKRYFNIARRQKGLVGENLLKLIERRIDNVIYRLGWASSRKFARQLITHKHILVNDRYVNIPSYLVNPGDKISLVDKMRNNIYVLKSIENTPAKIPSWIKYTPGEFVAEIVSMPTREDFSFPINETLIVEFYSK